jgi:hypothetical protein
LFKGCGVHPGFHQTRDFGNFTAYCFRFGLNDGITPTPNRENIIYNKETIAIIKERIKQVANFFVEKYNEATQEFDSLLAAWPLINQQSKHVDLNGKLFTINNLVDFATIPANTVKVKGLKYFRPKHFYITPSF